MKQSIAALVMVGTAACGGEAHDGLGQVESELLTNWAYGWRAPATATSAMCNGSPGACFLPNNKIVSVKVDTSGMTTAQRTLFLAQFNLAFNMWSAAIAGTGFSLATAAPGDPNPDVLIKRWTAQHAPLNDQRSSYAKIRCAVQGAVLPEVEWHPSDFRKCTTTTVELDMQNIDNKAAQGGISAANLMRDSIGYGLGHGFGNGTQSTTSTLFSDISIHPADKFSVLGSLEHCRMALYDPSVPPSVQVDGFNCVFP